MPALNSYDYAIVRLVPHVERGEYLNVGVILFCRTRRFLNAFVYLDEARLLALDSLLDLELVRTHLERIPLLCVGGKQAGPIGQLTQAERFHWLVSPRSALIQVSPVHSGLCADPEHVLHHLLKTLVLPENELP